MIRDEYTMPTWRRWAQRFVNALRLTKQSWGRAPDLIVMSPSMRRRLSIACAAKWKTRYRPVKALAFEGNAIPIVDEDDMRDGTFAVIIIEDSDQLGAV